MQILDEAFVDVRLLAEVQLSKINHGCLFKFDIRHQQLLATKWKVITRYNNLNKALENDWDKRFQIFLSSRAEKNEKPRKKSRAPRSFYS